MVLIATADNAAQRFGRTNSNAYASFARPANVDAYTAGDVMSDAASAGVPNAIEFKGCGKDGRIESVQVHLEDVVTETFELWLFDAEPTNHGDNAVLALVVADLPKLVGVYSLADGAKKTSGAVLTTYKADLDSVGASPRPFVSDDGSLYGLLRVVTGHTPASGTKVHVALGLTAEPSK
jgi:hypothetical protein